MLDLPKFLGMVFLVIGTAYVGVRIWSLEMILGSFFLVALTFNFLLPTLAFYFGGTDIIFNRKRFYVARLFLNVVYLQQNWSTSSIQYVFCREKTNINEVVIQVTNQLTKHQYVFGRSLTQAEQAWLVQEIQMWLNFT